MEQKLSELATEQKTSNMNQLNESTHKSMTCGPTIEFSEFIQRHHCIRDRKTYFPLQLDLVEHLLQLYGRA
jgi:hypothetical protein